MICDYWLFNHGFKYQESVCNGCHGLIVLNLNISVVTVIPAEGVNYLCIIHGVSKSEEIRLLENYLFDDCGYI